MALKKWGSYSRFYNGTFALLGGLLVGTSGAVLLQVTAKSVGTPRLPDTGAMSLVLKEIKIPMSYRTNIIAITKENKNFRQVLFTGVKSQLVVMSIPAGTDIGKETHKYTEQTLFFLSGTGEGELDGNKFPVNPGDVVVVTAGTPHNFRNTGHEPLKLYTVYAPPNHIDGRVHKTKAEAENDTADEAVGESTDSWLGPK